MNLIQTAAQRTGLTVADITGRSRRQDIVMVRHCLIYIMRTRYRMKVTEIGRMFNRDHTTVIHATANVNNMILTGYEPYARVHALVSYGTERANKRECVYTYGIHVHNFNLAKEESN